MSKWPRLSASGAIGAIFMLALLVRLVMIAVWAGAGQEGRLSGDSDQLYQIAESLVEGKGFELYGAPTSRRGPLYPLLIAAWLKAGFYPSGLELAQALLGAFSCVLLFLIAKHLFRTSVGLLAAFLFSFDYLLVKQTVYILPETLFIFFILTSFYFLFKSQTDKRLLGSLAAGLFAGLAVLTKETLSLYFPLMVIYFFMEKKGWRRAILKSLIFLAAFTSTLAPWLVRNKQVYRDGIFLTINAGHVLYLGNNPQVTQRIHGGDWINEDDTQYPKDDPALPPLLSLEADRYLMGKAIDYIRRHPVVFFKNMGIKALRLWFPFYSKAQVLPKWIMTVSYLIVIPCSIIGLLLTRGRWREFLPIYLLVAYVTFIHSVTIPGIRYRYPVMPFLMIFAAYGMLEAWNQFRGRAGRLVVK
ncbi:MAG: glycosyltransferase family 39 protein [Candidatus Omnitrophica bacterium]|nr:glycosyltransferase family 39 protein [Candidatus Omnitrophota bacterium]